MDKYNVDDEKDLKVISQRRSKIIQSVMGVEMQNNTANLLIDKNTGELYRKGEDNRVTRESDGEEIEMSDIPNKLDDYRMYLNNNFNDVDIKSQITRSYMKIQALAQMVGPKGVERDEYMGGSPAMGFFNAVGGMFTQLGEAMGGDANQIVQNSLDPNAKLENLDYAVASPGSIKLAYNKLVSEIRDLSAVYTLNFSPYDMEKGGFGEGLKVGSKEFLYLPTDERSTSYQLVQNFDNWTNTLAKDDREIAQKSRDKWFDKSGELKSKWSYNVGYQTPFWLRLAGEMLLTEATFGGAIGSTVETIGSMSKAAYFSTVSKGTLNASKVARLRQGSKTYNKYLEYQNAAVGEFSKLYFYNKTFGQGAGEMPYAFTVLGPVGVAYGKYMKYLTNPKSGGLFSKWNKIGRENIPYYRTATTPFRVGGQAAGSAVMLGVGETTAQTLEDGMDMDKFLKTNSLDHLTQNMALSLIMRGTSPGKINSELNKNLKADIIVIRNKKWYKNAVAKAEKDFGIKINDPTADREVIGKAQDQITAELTKRLKEKGLTLEGLESLKSFGFKFEDINENSTENEIAVTIAMMESKIKDPVRKNMFNIIVDGLIERRGLTAIKEMAIENNKAKTLEFELEHSLFIEETKLLEEKDAMMNKVVDNFMSNRLSAEDYMIMASQYSPEVFKQILEDRGQKDKNFLDAIQYQVEDAIDVVNQMSEIGLDLNSPEAKEFLNNRLESERLKQKIYELEKLEKQGKLLNTTNLENLKKRQEEISKNVENVDQTAQDVRQRKANEAIDRAIEQRKEAGGDVVTYSTNAELEVALNKLIDEGKLKADQFPDLVVDGKIKIPKDRSLDALNLISQQLKTTGESIGVPLLVINTKGENTQIDIHENTHPIVNVLIRRMGLNRNSPELVEFMNKFRYSLPTQIRKSLDAKFSKDLNIDVVNDKIPPNQVVEYFARYMEQVGSGKIDGELLTKGNFEAVKSLEKLLETTFENETGKKIDLDLGVNFVHQIAMESAKAKAENAFGPETKAIELDAQETVLLSEQEGGSMYMQEGQASEYKTRLDKKKETLDMYKEMSNEYTGELKTEAEAQIKKLEVEIKNMESNIETSDKNIEDIAYMKKLESLDAKELAEQGLETKLDELQTDLIDRNIGAVNQIYSAFPKNYDKQQENLWKSRIHDQLLDKMRKYEGGKGSVFNWLQSINLKWTDLKNYVEGKKEGVEVDYEYKDSEGNNITRPDVQLQDNNLEAITDAIDLSKPKAEKPIEERYINEKDAKAINNSNIEAESKITNNAFMFFRTLDVNKFIEKDGKFNHNKFRTEFNKQAASGDNQATMMTMLDKPTPKKLKDPTFAKKYNEQLLSTYNWLVDFAMENPQSIKNMTKITPKEGEASWLDWVDYGNRMSTKESLAKGTSVSDVHAGNKGYRITPPGFEVFKAMMTKAPEGSKNPGSVIAGKYVQVNNLLLQSRYQNALEIYVNNKGSVNPFNRSTNKFESTNNELLMTSGDIGQFEKLSAPLRPVDKTQVEINNNTYQASQSNGLDTKQTQIFNKKYRERLAKTNIDFGSNNEIYQKLKSEFNKIKEEEIYNDTYVDDQSIYDKMNKIELSTPDGPQGAGVYLEARDNISVEVMVEMQDTEGVLQEVSGLQPTGVNVESLNYRGKKGEKNKKKAPYFSHKVEVGKDANGKPIKKEFQFVNKDAWDAQNKYALDLGSRFVFGQGISLNHLVAQDRRQGYGRSDLYIWDPTVTDGKYKKAEKHSGLTSVIGENKFSKVNEKYKYLIEDTKNLNSVGTMQQVSDFIQFGDLPVTKWAEKSNGNFVYKGKTYEPTFEGKKELYNDVFNKKDADTRKAIFEANYEAKREFLNEGRKISEKEYNDRLIYLARIGKEGSGLTGGTRNMVWNQMMYIPKNNIKKVGAGQVFSFEGKDYVAMVDFKSKVEHLNPNVSMESTIITELNKNTEFSSMPDFEFSSLWSEVNYLDKGVDVLKSPKGKSLKTGGGGVSRLFTTGIYKDVYFKDGENVVSLAESIQKAGEQVANKKKAGNAVAETVTDISVDNIDIKSIEEVKTMVKLNAISTKRKVEPTEVDKGDGGIPAGTTGQETNQSTQLAPTVKSNKDVYSKGGEIVYQASSNTTRKANQTGKFSSDRKVVITMGAPGSGKSTLLKAFMEKNNITELENVNMDNFKEDIVSQFENLPADETTWNAEQRSLGGQIQALSIKEKKFQQANLIKQGKGMAIDMTGASYNSSSKIINELKENGYEVFILHADVSKERSLSMNRKRGDRGQRRLGDAIVSKTYDQLAANIEQYKIDNGENFFTVNTELLKEGTIPEAVSSQLYNKLNANEISVVKNPAKDPNLSAQASERLENNPERLKANTLEIMNRNLSAKNRKPMSPAEIKKAQSGLKYKLRFLPNSFQHLSTLSSRFFKYREDYEYVDNMTNGVFDKETMEYRSFEIKVLNDYKGLNKSITKLGRKDKQFALNIKKPAVGAFTVEDCVRVYCWNKNSFKPEGLTDAEMLAMNEYVLNNPGAKIYADKLMSDVVSSTPEGNTYFKPSENWQSGNIFQDLQMGIKNIRPEFMKQTVENFDIIYSKENIDKMALEIGDKNWKPNMEGVIEFIKNGRLSTYQDPGTKKAMGFALGFTRLGLVGSVRSFIGQGVSSTLFLGYGKGVRPWKMKPNGLKDITENVKELALFYKSDYMKQRGQNFDLAMNELNDLKSNWQGLKNKSVGLSFALSSTGDKAAIGIGAFYIIPQRISAVMKENPGMGKDKAREIVYKEFITFVENTQQSMWANRVSVGQKGALGKLTTGFLNTPIRYNNNAITALNKSLMKSYDTGKLDMRKSSRDLLTFSNYMIAQTAMFAAVSDGVMYTYLDDEMDPETRAEKLDESKARRMQSQVEGIINGTGTQGKILTTIYKGLSTYMSDDPKNARKDGVDVMLSMLDNMSPAISVRSGLIKGLNYDVKDIKKQKDLDFKDQEIMPYLKAATKVYALGTNQGITKEIVERVDDYRFVMDVRNTFWQKFAVFAGQSPWMVNKEVMKDIVKGKDKPKSSFPGSTSSGGYTPNLGPTINLPPTSSKKSKFPTR
jgi:predicted kinase